MARVSKPTTPALIYDPTTGKSTEAATTDQDEMARRAKKAEKDKSSKKK